MGMIGLFLALMLGAAVPWGKGPATLWTADVTFRPKERAVSNWRIEAMLHAEASFGTALTILLGRDPAAVTRCVRLNNYWCIKRAGWAGEIAADQEGHVAFASAAEGADVAALLLRHYYIDYGRHSASSIIAHWAPAACGLAAVAGNDPGRGMAVAAADHLATHGLRQTLRARFLAAHGRRVAAGASRRMRRSVVPDRLIGTTMRTPVIAIDLGTAPVRLPLAGFAGLPLNARAPRLPPGLSADRSTKALDGDRTCAGDAVRIKSYAAKAAAGVAGSPDEDLHLFDAAGRPTVNLGRVMRNMAAVEIGPLGAKAALVAAAVDHATRLAGR